MLALAKNLDIILHLPVDKYMQVCYYIATRENNNPKGANTMIDKHGLKMHGLKRASGETIDWGTSGWYTQISYDTETGDIYTNDHCGESWSVYPPEVITVCYTDRHMTMQQIADAIAESMAALEGITK